MDKKIAKKLTTHRAVLDQQWEGLADLLLSLGPTAMSLMEELDKADHRKFLDLAECGPAMTAGGKRLIHAAATLAISEGVRRMIEKIDREQG